MKYGLPESVIQKICNVFVRYPQIEKVLLYGSRAMGTARKGSDIDLSICGDDVDFSLLCRLLYELDELLLPYRIDLSIIRDMEDPEVLEHIRRVGVPFYVKLSSLR